MVVGPQEFRNALRTFASGVTVVAASLDEQPFGMTCTSFASVSLDPPLVMVCLENDSHTLAAVDGSRSFGVSVLSDEQEEIARAFSTAGPKPFGEVGYKIAPNGAPLLHDAIAVLECEVSTIAAAGDHHIVVGQVEACEADRGNPLLYFDRHYRRTSDDRAQPPS
jgi:3-hydroxy-9,10-secoandrosta-1,3,5(10)-triene-9,17-dione monooxygenase reductase component